ncbi:MULTISPECIES: YfaZ family outer membrane protein [unclassified Oleiphilus]|jgi:hypothetical protein|uniref:YfaZ family outer membrane protein n=6 Tax=Oleiphilus TaxID=141450 RepID=UPI0007C33AF8|nr:MULTISPECIES: YfaZ family outer membrane protein [unclassified Oleiphilus]KZY40705.1 hypothetical protein A3732_19470 [Oleiphilus sp. HI0050]KZY76315.1 hypothetical protein A3740_13070 [Oleiphilus sp. HI0068]KZY86303.1 hypothetical protein A3741_02185 [Oleiphilus sp. HI0069]KZY86362.1 hypothetical protein A3743_02510 [Oleiphilus sp. HI0072]KZZ10523.1 hypothetical protein A3749_10935 [Oleiphilus sp. HI0078]
MQCFKKGKLNPGLLSFIGLIGYTLVLSTPTAHADEIDLRLSNDAVHGNYTKDNSRSKARFGMGYFYKDDDYTTNILNVDLHAKGQTVIGNMPATVAIGFESNFFKIEDFKGTAVGIGGSLRLNLPSAPGLSFETDLHYAPKVLSFGDSDEFSRFRTQVNYRIIENADIAFGFRYMNVGSELDGKNETLESGVYLGLQLAL